jgi:ABC-2 type transport system permease protein
MTFVLVRKLLRDIRIAWIIVAILLFLFQILWARICQRTTNLIGEFNVMGIDAKQLQAMVLKKNDFPGRMVQSIIGGENIEIDRAGDFMSISYVHPLVLTVLTIWAIGRSANAIAGEIDRGTMELLLAQPIERSQLIIAHLWVDMIVLPTLCAAVWIGTYCGTLWMGLQTPNPDIPLAQQEMLLVQPTRFLPALFCIFGLLFAVSGFTMWISSLGRSRATVWGWGVSIFLAMFLINVLGQLWPEVMDWIRPLTVFYHYLPQDMVKSDAWWANTNGWLHLAVLLGIGAAGYAAAWFTFTRRDLPAPL